MSETPNPDTSLNGLVADLVDHEPIVREEIVSAMQENAEGNGEVIPQEAETPAVENGSNSGPTFTRSVDPNPSVFNPEIHSVDENGKPRLRIDGTFAKKRGRRPGYSGNASGSKNVTIDYRGTAQFFAGLMFSSCTAAMGPAWEPKTDERTNVENAATRYCESKGIGDLPPGIALCLVVSLYALPRVNDEETRKRCRSVGERFGLITPLPKPVERRESQPPPANVKIPVVPVENPLSQFVKG